MLYALLVFLCLNLNYEPTVVKTVDNADVIYFVFFSKINVPPRVFLIICKQNNNNNNNNIRKIDNITK